MATETGEVRIPAILSPLYDKFGPWGVGGPIALLGLLGLVLGLRELSQSKKQQRELPPLIGADDNSQARYRSANQ